MAVGYLTEQSIQIARGLVRGASGLHKFGAVPAMSQNETGTIWDINDTVYPWSSFSTASVLTAQAVNASDNNKILTLEGLDSDYNFITDTITLSSSGTVATTKTFLRVFRGYISTGANNVGVIDVRIESTTVLYINVGLAQTLMCIYTVPAGKTLYLTKGTCTAQSGADGNGNFFIRFFGQSAFRIQHTFEVTGSGGQYLYDFTTPFTVPEKSDIDIRIITRTNNGRYTASFDGILFDTPRTMQVD
jgi:hypothetical protein